MSRLYLIFIFSMLAAFSLHAQVYVKADAIGSNNGSSWQNAYTNLDSALSLTMSGEIWVCKGTYKPSKYITDYTTYKAFLINKPIQLLGGFTGVETSVNQRDFMNNITILSGDIGTVGDSTDNTHRVLVISGTILNSTTAIDGFTITKAWSITSGKDGAVYFRYAGSPVFRNCIITGNQGYSGAGIYIEYSNPTIESNIVVNNVACQGAGIYVDQGQPIIRNNRIIFNKAAGPSSSQKGGGIYVASYSSPTISNNLIENNYAAQNGGGVELNSNYQITIQNNIISNNIASKGGGISVENTNTNIINNLIVNNHSLSIGGGLFDSYGEGLFINNTIANNTSANIAGAFYFEGVDMQIVNNIISNNNSVSGKSIVLKQGPINAYPRFKYCDVNGGIDSIEIINLTPVDSIWMVGNITGIPVFTDTTSYDFHLANSSPCINTGNPDTSLLNLPVYDISGSTRFLNNRIDMGCYEFGTAYPSHLKVTPDSVNLEGWHDSTFNLSIQSGSNWNIYNVADWVNINSLHGSGNSNVPITAYKNNDLINGRSSNLLVSAGNNIPSIPVSIIQSFGGFFFIPDTLFINGNVDDTASFFINSNLKWYFQSYPSLWLQFNVLNGITGQTVIAKAKNSNTTNNIRQAIITIHYGNALPGYTKTMIVIQSMAAVKLCPGGSISLSSGLSGGSYQWQINTGTGYISISDGGNYSGTNSSTLQLTNIPSSFYGYRYRCISGNVNSNVFSIAFENTWNGSVSSAWENPLNWSCGVVPDANTDVIIFAGNIYISVSTSIRKLTVNSSAHIFIQPGVNLTITH